MHANHDTPVEQEARACGSTMPSATRKRLMTQYHCWGKSPTSITSEKVPISARKLPATLEKAPMMSAVHSHDTPTGRHTRVHTSMVRYSQMPISR